MLDNKIYKPLDDDKMKDYGKLVDYVCTSNSKYTIQEFDDYYAIVETPAISDENMMEFEHYQLKNELNRISEKLLQHVAGEKVPGINNLKKQFVMKHNRLRELEGKTPREVRNSK